MAKFIGRTTEFNALKNLLQKKSASLVTIKGRRRIGKSRLVYEFAKEHPFYAFSGLPPTPQTTAQTQRSEFCRQFSEHFDLPKLTLNDWGDIFSLLAKEVKQGRCIILFDEISWMGFKDSDFLGKIKNAWDLQFSHYDELILILCGSVSSWIEKNIINSTGFVGRPSLYLTLDELPLARCNEFWNTHAESVSAYEKFKLLSVTGGIPRYLELINPTLSAEENIKNLCFVKHGALTHEFEQIFTDIYAKRSGIYLKLIQTLVDGPKEQAYIAKKVDINQSNDLSEYLDDLMISGCIARDYTWNIKTAGISKLSYYRLKDNYVRFYLKYILPNKARIEKDAFAERTLTSLPAWDSIIGLQFENLVLNNHKAIIHQLGIRPEDVVFDNPFFQRKTARQAGCQIDYLIQTRYQTVYICEIKFFRFEIKPSIIKEMQEKLTRLSLPKNYSYRVVLIHVNGVREDVIDSGFFSNIIDFSDLLDEK